MPGLWLVGKLEPLQVLFGGIVGCVAATFVLRDGPARGRCKSSKNDEDCNADAAGCPNTPKINIGSCSSCPAELQAKMKFLIDPTSARHNLSTWAARLVHVSTWRGWGQFEAVPSPDEEDSSSEDDASKSKKTPTLDQHERPRLSSILSEIWRSNDDVADGRGTPSAGEGKSHETSSSSQVRRRRSSRRRSNCSRRSSTTQRATPPRSRHSKEFEGSHLAIMKLLHTMRETTDSGKPCGNDLIDELQHLVVLSNPVLFQGCAAKKMEQAADGLGDEATADYLLTSYDNKEEDEEPNLEDIEAQIQERRNSLFAEDGADMEGFAEGEAEGGGNDEQVESGLDSEEEESGEAELKSDRHKRGKRNSHEQAERKSSHELKPKRRSLEMSRFHFSKTNILEACDVPNPVREDVWAALGQMGDWQNFDVFRVQEVAPRTLPLVCHHTLSRTGLADMLSVSVPVLQEVLSAWEAAYQDVPYHNALHAADVTSGVYHTLATGGLSECISKTLALSMVLAAVVHDIGHPGVSNAFLVAQGAPMALRYNDKSVLESMHCATAFEILKATGVDLLGALGGDHAKVLRKDIIDIVLHTDMAHHADSIAECERIVGAGSTVDWSNRDIQATVAKASLHAADISNPVRPWGVYQQWVGRVMEEFFIQADQERQLGLHFPGSLSFLDRSKPMNVPKFQLGFASVVVLPLYNSLDKLSDVSYAEKTLTLTANIERLKEEGDRRAAELEAASTTA